MATQQEAPKIGEDVVQWINKVVDMCVQYLGQHRDRDEPVVRFKTPEELEKIINFQIDEKGVGLDGILKDIQSTMDYSTRTGHVRFFNQLWAGADIPAILGEWLTAVMNGSMYTYEVAPVFSMYTGDGVFAPGGAHCNLLAILAARNFRAQTAVRKNGLLGHPQMVCFSSEHDHYTIQRSAGVLGIGEENCIKIPVDNRGLIIPAEFEKAILKAKSEGKHPFFVNATAGTTVLGAYDPLSEIADIAHKYGLWAHLDACWGGHAFLSKKYRHLLNGAEKFESVAWTATKCLGLPQQCAALLLRDRHQLVKCNAMGKDYLFHEHDEMDFDLGEKTLNCGRRNDALKLWVSWKVVGDKGFEERVDHAFAQAEYIQQQLKKQQEKFRVLLDQPQSLNICFWYIPPSARQLPEGSEKEALIDKATLTIRRRMQKEGKLLVNYSDLHGHPAHFFRMITCNPGANQADMDFVLAEIDRLGSDL